MGRSFQQQSLRRKLIYFGLIAGLFTVSYAVRHADFTLGRTRVSGIVAQARTLDLREQDQGQADLTGSTLNLIFTGSRGLVVCALWWGTDELKARHEWNELEQSIKVITKLQPHFITPWLFQSWNLAYNVSWESDRLRDKYFYIARGLDLLADGERRNRDNPDLRYHMGWFYLNKIGFSDQSKTLRSLFQMSCIDPIELDRARFFPDPRDSYTVDVKVFEKFCQAHPILVRRLREGLHLETPKEVVDFLLDNRKIPNRFQERADTSGDTGTPLKAPAERFPILPPKSQFDPDDFTQDTSDLPDDFDNFAAARLVRLCPGSAGVAAAAHPPATSQPGHLRGLSRPFAGLPGGIPGAGGLVRRRLEDHRLVPAGRGLAPGAQANRPAGGRRPLGGQGMGEGLPDVQRAWRETRPAQDPAARGGAFPARVRPVRERPADDELPALPDGHGRGADEERRHRAQALFPGGMAAAAHCGGRPGLEGL